MADHVQTLAGAQVDIVTTPTLVSTGESLTLAELFVAHPEYATLGAYDGEPEERVYPIFTTDVAQSRLSVTVRYQSGGQLLEHTLAVMFDDPRVDAVVSAFNTTWQTFPDVRVRARNDGARWVITAARSVEGIDPIALQINNSAALGSDSVTQTSPHALFRYYAPDPRAVSHVGDVTPPPPRSGSFTTPKSRGVAFGEERTSHSLNRGLDEAIREFDRQRDAADRPVTTITLQGALYANEVLLPSLPQSFEDLDLPVRGYTDEGGTLLAFRGAKWRVESPFFELIDLPRNAALALYSTPRDDERPGNGGYHDASLVSEWRVHYGPNPLTPGQRSATLANPALLDQGALLTAQYVMVDATTIEIADSLTPQEQLTEAILRDTATGEAMYVTEWIGPFRARLGRLSERASARHAAAQRAGVVEYAETLPGGEIALHRGPYIEPHEWVIKYVPGFYPDASTTTTIAVRGVATGVVDVDFYRSKLIEDPIGVVPYAEHVAALQRRSPYARELAPLVTDETILQAGRYGLNHHQRSTLPTGPFVLNDALVPAAATESRASVSGATAVGTSTTTHLHAPAPAENPYLAGDDPDKLAVVLSRWGQSRNVDSVSDVTDELLADFEADVDAAEVSRARSVARRYMTLELTGVTVYPAARRITDPQGGFSYDLIGRSGVVHNGGVITITAVLSPYQVEFEYVDLVTKDPPVDTSTSGATVTIVPDALGSLRDINLSPASASRYWEGVDSATATLVDLVGDTQLAAGNRVVFGGNNRALVTRGFGYYLVCGVSINADAASTLTGGETIHHLYGERYTGTLDNDLGNFFDTADGASDVADRSTSSYEYFVLTSSGSFYRGACHASDAIGFVQTGVLRGVALPLPTFLGAGVPIINTAGVFLRSNALVSRQEGVAVSQLTAKSAYVDGPIDVVGRDGGSESASVHVEATDLAPSSRVELTADQSDVLLRVSTEEAVCRVAAVSDAGDFRVYSYCAEGVAETHVVADDHSVIVTPLGLEVRDPQEDSLSPSISSWGPYRFSRTVGEDVEQVSVDMWREIDLLRHAVSSLSAIAGLTANALEHLNVQHNRMLGHMYIDYENFVSVLDMIRDGITAEDSNNTLGSIVDDGNDNNIPTSFLLRLSTESFASLNDKLEVGWTWFKMFKDYAWQCGGLYNLTDADITALLGMTAWDNDVNPPSNTWDAIITALEDRLETGSNPTALPSVSEFNSARQFFRFYRLTFSAERAAERRESASLRVPGRYRQGGTEDAFVVDKLSPNDYMDEIRFEDINLALQAAVSSAAFGSQAGNTLPTVSFVEADFSLTRTEAPIAPPSGELPAAPNVLFPEHTFPASSVPYAGAARFDPRVLPRTGSRGSIYVTRPTAPITGLPLLDGMLATSAQLEDMLQRDAFPVFGRYARGKQHAGAPTGYIDVDVSRSQWVRDEDKDPYAPLDRARYRVRQELNGLSGSLFYNVLTLPKITEIAINDLLMTPEPNVSDEGASDNLSRIQAVGGSVPLYTQALAKIDWPTEYAASVNYISGSTTDAEIAVYYAGLVYEYSVEQVRDLVLSQDASGHYRSVDVDINGTTHFYIIVSNAGLNAYVKRARSRLWRGQRALSLREHTGTDKSRDES